MRKRKCLIGELEMTYEDGELRMMIPEMVTSSKSPTAIALLANFLDRTARQMLKDQQAPEPHDPPLEGPVPEVRPWSSSPRARAPGRFCVVCGGEQRRCRGGWVCEQGHGGGDWEPGPVSVQLPMKTAPKDKCIEVLGHRGHWVSVVWGETSWISGSFCVFPSAWRPCTDPNCKHPPEREAVVDEVRES